MITKKKVTEYYDWDDEKNDWVALSKTVEVTEETPDPTSWLPQPPPSRPAPYWPVWPTIIT